MTRVLSALCAVLLCPLAIAATPALDAEGRVFDDIWPDSPYYEATLFLAGEGVIKGYADGKFKPYDTINRAEFVKILTGTGYAAGQDGGCIASVASEGSVYFPDVPFDAWFAHAVCVAKRNGLVDGYPDGTFRPEQTITVAEAAKIVAAATWRPLPGDPWYAPSVLALEEIGALPDTFVTLDQELTRGEMAEVMYRIRAGIRNRAWTTLEDLQRATDYRTVFSMDDVEIGDVHGGMVLSAVESYGYGEGRATFVGEVTLTAAYVALPVADGMGPSNTVCFHDLRDGSAYLLPALSGRSTYFCLLPIGPLSAHFEFPSEGVATVVIDDFTVNYFGAEVWDTARLVRVVEVRPGFSAENPAPVVFVPDGMREGDLVGGMQVTGGVVKEGKGQLQFEGTVTITADYEWKTVPKDPNFPVCFRNLDAQSQLVLPVPLGVTDPSFCIQANPSVRAAMEQGGAGRATVTLSGVLYLFAGRDPIAWGDLRDILDVE